MPAFFVQLAAFVRRDALTRASYRMGMLSSLATMVFVLLVLAFMSKMIASGQISFLSSHATDYFSFVLLGMIAAQFFSAATSGIGSEIRHEQMTGVLEVALSAPITPVRFLLCSAASALAARMLAAALLITLAVLGFGLSLAAANWGLALLTLALSVTAYLPFGLACAASVICFRTNDPVSRALAAATTLLSGVYFPREILPAWLRAAGDVLPVTHASVALRRALLEGASLSDIAPSLSALALFAAVGLPVGALLVNAAVHKARSDGSLGAH